MPELLYCRIEAYVEAYRRWVCSTLVPYFAEPSDVIIIDDNSNNYNNKNINNNAHQRNKDKNNNYNESEISKVAATNAITHHTVSMTRNVSAANTTHNSLYSLSPPLSLTSSLLPTSAFVKGSRDEMTTTNLRRTAGNATALLTANLIVPRNENHHQKRQEEQQLNNNNDNSNYHKIDVNFINNIYINSNSNNKNNIINFINHERSKPNLNKPQKSSIKSEQIQQSPAITYSDVIHYDTKQNDINVDMNYPTLVTTRRQKRNIINDTGQQQQQQQHQQEQEQLQSQSNNFISTANNMNPVRREGSVISQNFMKRIKRKIEFRKRRRIRPCLSVCQTVEQKCPYLLPADRAPALPTQYAGEPTFLCLDQNIPETGEQLEKSSHGPADCCYTYCGEAQNGLCTYCNEYAEIRELYPSTISENKRKIHNITLQPTHIKNEKTPIRLETRIRAKLGLNQTDDNILMASVAIAITNETLWRTNETQLIERLPYYAYCDGVFYYDDDINDMPEKATSGNCYPLPTMQSRCTTPYYADDYPSAAKRSRELSRSQCWLLWLSIILCLSSTYRSVNYQTIQRRIFHHEGYKYIDDGVIQLHKRQSIIAYDYNKRLPNKRLMKWMFEVMMMRRKVGITVYNNGVEGSTLKILSQFARRSKLKLNIYKRNDSHGNNKINLATPYTYKNNLLLFVKENLIIIIIKIVNATTVAVVVIIFTNALTKTGTLRMLKRNNSNSSNINNNNNNNNNNAKFHTFHVKGNNQEEKFNTNSSRQRRRQDKDKGSQSQSQTHCSYSCSSNDGIGCRCRMRCVEMNLYSAQQQQQQRRR
uniref:Uncharacterized protein n=1 Tax=Glossina brevipalpis TaxID=37001 RepID=A0A1A9WK24_9MUSC